MIKHFTTSVYLIEEDRVLLLFHPKHQKWLPPGGHLEANETPSDGARREVLEETGYTIEFIKDERVWLSYYNAKSIERPYLVLLEEIPSYKDQPAHQHIDLIYLAKPLAKIAIPSPLLPQKWFSLNEIDQLPSDEAIFQETKDVINTFLKRDFAKFLNTDSRKSQAPA